MGMTLADLERTMREFLAPSLRVGLPGGPTITPGSGSPEGVLTAPVASLYFRIDGGVGTTLYKKESGTGNTGWVADTAGGGSTSAYYVPLDVTGGTVNAIEAELTGALPVLGGGAKMIFGLVPSGASTGGSVSIQIDGVVPDQRLIKYPDGTDIRPGTWATGDLLLLDYRENVGNFMLLAPQKPVPVHTATLNVPGGAGRHFFEQAVANSFILPGSVLRYGFAATTDADENGIEGMAGIHLYAIPNNGYATFGLVSEANPFSGPHNIWFEVVQ